MSFSVSPDALSIWVIYDHPTDFPHNFVARRHVAYGPDAGPTADLMIAPDLGLIRKEMERRGLTRLHRFPEDDDKIVETWL
jgi:hypothetical protein